jgi:hypothetical protein
LFKADERYRRISGTQGHYPENFWGLEKMEDSREKMFRIKAMNKMKKSRIVVSRNFFNKTGIVLSDEHFLSLFETTTARTMLYMMVKNCDDTKSIQNLVEVIEDLKTILGTSQHLFKDNVILLHFEDIDSGAIIITFSEFSNHYVEIIKFLNGNDVVVFQNKGEFGICFEVEEHAYLKTVWGI